jgi:hypothetical protein
MANIASNKTKPPTIFLGMFPPQNRQALLRLNLRIQPAKGSSPLQG